MVVAERILMVDDEPRVLDGLRRNLAGKYDVELASSGTEALGVLAGNQGADDPFAVIVSDMMMPGMNGAEFLAEAKKVTPDAVMMILSGQADLRSTVAAVNNSNLFRFLGKPCSPHDLRTALDDALRQFRLVHAERELLQRTLTGAVDVLVEALALASPEAGSRTRTVAALVGGAADRLELADDWELRIAAQLSQIGLISIPTEVLSRAESGAELDPRERAMVDAHPGVAHDLLVRIPRLQRAAEWIGGQPVDGGATGAPDRDRGRQILDAAVEFAGGRDRGERPPVTAHRLTASGRYLPDVVEAVLAAAGELEGSGALRVLTVGELLLGMVFEQDVTARSGATLVRKGDVVTDTVRLRLRNFANSVGVTEPLRVWDGAR
jgi:response regulator RpfG family c-di-GMP phosphodiesterase